ncbi:sarcosine oxidase subunit gamma [Aestuariivirga sp.]|uniref:sarcosine oxidase subunit gamma n=1 Tax=Aestuariivirga sp. TaxID=2650926 RepID=UPI00391BBF28
MPDTSEIMLPRVSPLRDVAVQGRFGASRGVPGVSFSVRHPLSIVTVIARAGQGAATGAALKPYAAQWAGPDQYFVLAEGRGEGALYRELKAALAGIASVSDQSHGRVVIRICGPKARAVLAKGTPVDLHPDHFPVGKSAMTQMAHVGVHLTRIGEDSYDLSVFRGFSESFWEWITEQAEEFGYQVT